ncbi:MAG: DUF2490 domain-containing protein [Methylomonas sp.]|jgi:hypothetical protein|uniref:DUF2490 domain-containing protein n=1 Tax=Methylomonas sp. TaxID=418 RepID=UPI0025D9B781|nr:DUF2490 domain-containing protein [Methylomonas sp.]MCK9608249.1 DUF2490 domain-containing protein [Methylomonas sp.]
MRNKLLTTLKILPLLATGFAPVSHAVTNDVGGTWSSLTLSGSLDKISPKLKSFRWLVMNQARTQDDNPGGNRFSENLLFAQVGYDVTKNASFWVGYTHDWLHPLDKLAYQESRPYEDFLWNSSLKDLRFTARTRLEQRIRQGTGDVGVRLRQLFQLSYPLAFINEDLRMYAGEEMLLYVNNNSFGRTGFSENRAFGGFNYQITKQLGADLGYMGQYVYSKAGNNLFTHNVQFNLSYKF